MTTLMSPSAGYQFMPTAPHTKPRRRTGILLNGSPSSSAPNSPKCATYLAPSSSSAAAGIHQVPFSSHSSASSSTSSTDDILSSTSATSAGGTMASSSKQSSRKIRFAPLPEPRRDEYDEDLLSPGFYEVDSAASSPNFAASALQSPSVSANVIPPTPIRLAFLKESHAQASGSTLGLSFDGTDPTDSGQATETNTIIGSECGTDETPTMSNSRKNRWSKLLRLPKAGQLKQPPRTPDEHGQFTLWRSSSRESNASVCSSRASVFGYMFGSHSEPNGSSTSLGNPISRRRTFTGADSAPTSPLSFRGGLSLKPVTSEAGTATAPAARSTKTSSAPPTARRETRLLNGRIYGRRQNGPPKNLFANIKDTEPEFVEWGHGGMGSVRNTAGAGSSKYAALQSNRKLSVGHDDGSGAADDDDGGGMGWVRRRREARERERKEREEREAREKTATEGKTEPDSDGSRTGEREESKPEHDTKEVLGPVSPKDASEDKERRLSRVSEETQAVVEQAEQMEEKDKKGKEHVYTAVNVPAPRPHNGRSNSRTHSLLGSTQPTPGHSATATPTAEKLPFMLTTTSPPGSPTAASALGPSPLALSGVTAEDEASMISSSASSSFEDESPVGDKDEDRDEEAEDSEDEEDDEQARRTAIAIGAGVEKISRHKD
ncbi:uncharacterized protein FOMMEDRAFT_18326 [Fomitiporia mediterranea MF3/22]|uniref:uncharacterized protein n=1 Tax=Fomitiporia mediterranea (strain MF3/22) TaxID=694068 RepID=UPI0004408B11|nr:uncharacterized protein FOMMEDRAFT_18326 [Fomitiporia mediterranea MF3/22]EJD06132.1 hypothetical protein FOMMEDRAFT_18326 [Fomitiporia mediterranea MF3/22]